MEPICQKKRHIVRTEQNGFKHECYRCAHGASKNYKQEVEPTICEGCVLRQILLSRQPCSTKPPKKPVYNEPQYGEDGEIIYEKIEGAKPPECPDGYERRKDGWTFDPVWFPCPYRLFNNDLNPDGSVKVKAYCAVTRKPVNFEECDRCRGALASVGAKLNTNHIPEIPGFTEQAQNYWRAIRKWIAAGRPTRNDGEVEEIHRTYCKRCAWYDEERKRCKGCGCKVRPDGTALLNKIRMATEHCPRNFW